MQAIASVKLSCRWAVSLYVCPPLFPDHISEITDLLNVCHTKSIFE